MSINRNFRKALFENSICLVAFLLLVMIDVPVLAGDISWNSVGPGGGGYITVIECDPRNSDIVYAGSDVGGFYISYDRGKTWKVRNEGLNDYYVQCIAVHPNNSDIIILGNRGGIFKSVDAGRTWKWKRSGFPLPSGSRYSAPINSLAYDPKNPSVIYAGIGYLRGEKYGEGKIYKSIDGGEHWGLCTTPGSLHPEAIVGDLKVSMDGTYILAVSNKGIYRSTDKGTSWIEANKGLPHLHCLKADISRSNPLVCYLTLKTTAQDKEPWNGGVYKSTDGGVTWSPFSSTLPQRVKESGQSNKFSSMYEAVAIHPQNPSIVYLGADSWVTNGVYKTINGGATWNSIFRKTQNVEYGWLTSLAPTIKTLAISNILPDMVFCGTSTHIFVSLNGGISWQQRYCQKFTGGFFRSNGLETTCVLEGLFDSHDPKRLYFCYRDIGLLVTENFNDSYYHSSAGINCREDVTNVIVEPTNTNKIWACAGTGECRGVYLSTDGGKTWRIVGSPASGLPLGKIGTILIDPTSSVGGRILYATCSGYGIYKSVDDGLSWSGINNGLPEVGRKNAVDIVINPDNPKNLRCLLGTTTADGSSGIYMTQDSGQNWQRISEPDTPFAMVRDLAVDPKNWNILYVCQFNKWIEKPFPGGLYRSTDGGKHWTHIYSHFKNAECVAVSPADSNILYLGTCEHPYHDNCRAPGILKSTDGGMTWYEENSGLTNTQIASISISPHHPSVLLVGTMGNGMFIGVDMMIVNKLRPPTELRTVK